jgi:hypothetical protein
VISVHEIGGADTVLGAKLCRAFASMLNERGHSAAYRTLAEHLDHGPCFCLNIASFPDRLNISIEDDHYIYGCSGTFAPGASMATWLQSCIDYFRANGALDAPE